MYRFSCFSFIQGVTKKNSFVATKKKNLPFSLKIQILVHIGRPFLGQGGSSPEFRSSLSRKGEIKKMVGVQLSGVRLTWYHKKLPAQSYAPSDRHGSGLGSVQVISKIGGSISMVPEKAIRGELRAIQRTQTLFRYFTHDLKNRGFNWRSTRKSYPRCVARYPTDAKLVSLLNT